MKKVITILLCLCLLCGCQSKDSSFGILKLIKEWIQKDPTDEMIDERYEADQYIKALKNYTVRDKNSENTTDNEEFDEFLTNIFVETLESDYTTMHFDVVDYKAYGIEKPEVSFGEVNYALNTEAIDSLLVQLEELQSYDYSSLSYRQQYDYEALEYSLYESLAMSCYYKYTLLFSAGNDTVANLVSILNDFTFYDQESVEDYLILLQDADRYINDCVTYTEQQREDGIYMLDSSIEKAQEYLEDFCTKTDDNALITSFNSRIDKLDFYSNIEKEQLKNQNADIVINEVIPCLQSLNKTLKSYKGKTTIEKNALYNFSEEYAELVYMLEASDNSSMDEQFVLLNNVYNELLEQLNVALENEDAVHEYLELEDSDLVGSSDSEEILNFLRANISKIYPDLGEVEFDVQTLDETSGSNSVTAYYWTAPIDMLNQNIIRVNPNNMGAGFESYSTLAHEGFPGHLYQHVYYFKSNPNDFRDIISFIGYTEGWAVQAQNDATELLNTKYEDTVTILNVTNMYYFLEYSIIDMGYNIYGWDSDDVKDYLVSEGIYPIFNYLYYYDDYKEYGFTIEDIRDYYKDEGYYDEYSEMLLEYIADMPGTFVNYGVGFANMYSLRSTAKELAGDSFNIVDYNEIILKNGPLPFSILKKAVEEAYR